jgi:hypothetical protein
VLLCYFITSFFVCNLYDYSTLIHQYFSVYFYVSFFICPSSFFSFYLTYFPYLNNQTLLSYIQSAVETILKIHKKDENGHILVFLTGQEQIEKVRVILFVCFCTHLSILFVMVTVTLSLVLFLSNFDSTRIVFILLSSFLLFSTHSSPLLFYSLNFSILRSLSLPHSNFPFSLPTPSPSIYFVFFLSLSLSCSSLLILKIDNTSSPSLTFSPQSPLLLPPLPPRSLPHSLNLPFLPSSFLHLTFPFSSLSYPRHVL